MLAGVGRFVGGTMEGVHVTCRVCSLISEEGLTACHLLDSGDSPGNLDGYVGERVSRGQSPTMSASY